MSYSLGGEEEEKDAGQCVLEWINGECDIRWWIKVSLDYSPVLKEKLPKMHSMKHRATSNESALRMAPIELPKSAIESSDVDGHKSQAHQISVCSTHMRLTKQNVWIIRLRLKRNTSKSFTSWPVESSEKRETSETYFAAVFKGGAVHEAIASIQKRLWKTIFFIFRALCRTYYDTVIFSIKEWKARY